jgi:hypothetical protein
MHKSATKCNEKLGKWCKNKHVASKIIDTLETYQQTTGDPPSQVAHDRDAGKEQGNPPPAIDPATE